MRQPVESELVLSSVAERVTAKEHHEVKLKKKGASRVRVTPFLNGTITDLKVSSKGLIPDSCRASQSKTPAVFPPQTEMKECARTVLLTGIPDVMEQEDLQDLLQIYFQKSTNGGGEIQACLYNPLGQCVSAVFNSVSDDQDT